MVEDNESLAGVVVDCFQGHHGAEKRGKVLRLGGAKAGTHIVNTECDTIAECMGHTAVQLPVPAPPAVVIVAYDSSDRDHHLLCLKRISSKCTLTMSRLGRRSK